MELVLVDRNNYLDAIKIQNSIFPNENGSLNILASLDRDLFMQTSGLYYEDDHVKYYLARENGNYVGITGLYYYGEDGDNVWLAWFGIKEEFRGQGKGRELLKETISLAKSKGFKHLRLYTDSLENHNAINLYQKEGFIGEKYTKETLAYDCWIYSKSLMDDNTSLWNNKNLNLGYQSELDHMDDKKIQEIVSKYVNMFKK